MIVDLDIISAGQLLRTALRRKDGRVLLAKGTVLSKPMLTALRKRGVTRLDVEPAPDRTPDSFDRATIESALDHRFSLVVDDPFMQALRRHALNALGAVVGETTADDLLARIFADFCIGK